MTCRRIRTAFVTSLLFLLVLVGATVAEPAAGEPFFLRAWGGEGEFLRRGQGVAVAANKTIFVSNTVLNRITRLTTDGRVNNWGQVGPLPHQFANPPRGLALDNVGLVYVTDESPSVKVYEPDGDLVRTLVVPLPDFAGEDVAVGGGKAYVLSNASTPVAVFALDGTHLGGWGTEGNGVGLIDRATGIALDVTRGWVYVVDTGRDKVLKFTTSGAFLMEFGAAGNGPGQFIRAHKLAVDSVGRVYVADIERDKVLVFASDGSFVTEFDGGAGNRLFNPRDVFILTSSSDDIYVIDDDYVRRFVAARLFDNNPATEPFDRAWSRDPAEYARLRAILAGQNGLVFAADRSVPEAGGRFAGGVYNASGTLLTTWPIDIDLTTGMSQDAAGAVYAALPRRNRVHKFTFNASLQATKAWTLGSSAGSDNAHFNAPSDVANDAAGNVYVADTLNNRVQVFSGGGVYQRTIANPGSGPGQFLEPVSLGFDSDGNLFLFERGGLRVLKFAPNGAFLDEWGGEGTGEGQFSRPPAPPSELAYWQYPVLAVQGDEVYVTDPLASRIQVFDRAGNFVTKWGSSGVGIGQFGRDMDISVASNGDIYVADADNSRVQVFNFDPTLGNPAPRLIQNGNMEANPSLTGWARSTTRGRVLSTTRQPGAVPGGGGSSVMRIGEVVPATQQAQKTAWASQVIYVHPDLARPALTFDHNLHVNDTIHFSTFQLDVMDAFGVNSQALVASGYAACNLGPLNAAAVAMGWHRGSFDLTPYRGQYVRVVFSIRNAWPVSKGIWAELDNVAVTDAPAQAHRSFVPAASWTCGP